MKKRFREIIDLIDYEDLLKIKSDIESGGIHLKRLISSKIQEQQKRHDEVCGVCTNEINNFSTHNYTLIFGPQDFRKKATFCGVDCLEYFLKHLKKIREVKNDDRIPEHGRQNV